MRQAILYRTVPLAVLLLVLILLVTYHGLPTASKGLRVGIKPDTCNCYSADRFIVLHIADNGELFINLDPIILSALSSRLSELYSPRAERVLYLKADDDVPFQRVAEVIETVQHTKRKVFPTTSPTPQELPDKAADTLNIEVQLIIPHAEALSCPERCWGMLRRITNP